MRYAAAMEALGGEAPCHSRAHDPALVPCAPPEYVAEAKAFDAANTRLGGAAPNEGGAVADDSYANCR